jgi:hypothetical protein
MMAKKEIIKARVNREEARTVRRIARGEGKTVADLIRSRVLVDETERGDSPPTTERGS